MIAGLPAASWLLIIFSVGAGLAIEIAFLRAHRQALGRHTKPDAASGGNLP